MATAESVKAKLQGLLSLANSTTGGTDANLTAAVNTLVAGFGQGGGDSAAFLGNYQLVYGQFTPSATGNFTVSADFPGKILYASVWLADPSVIAEKYGAANIMVESHSKWGSDSAEIYYATNGVISSVVKAVFGIDNYFNQYFHYRSHANWPGQPETYNWIAVCEVE